MSREVVIIQRCDTCQEPATETFTVGAISGEAQPKLHLIDVCDLHSVPLIELEAAWSALAPWEQQSPAPRTRKAKARQIRQEPSHDDPSKVCDLCGRAWATKQGLANHIWRQHVGVPRPYLPLECPDCGRVSKTAVGASMHRQRAHGYDIVAEAYAEAQKTGKR